MKPGSTTAEKNCFERAAPDRIKESQMKLNRVLLSLVALATALAAHADVAAPVTNATSAIGRVPARRPSIIYIQFHGLARGDLSCYGQTNYLTPNLDRLAADGIRFTHYTGGVDSAATTAELLAGKNSAPAATEANLAQRLQVNGYHTGLIGEWTGGGQPWTHGFDEFAGFLDDKAAQNYFADALWRYAPDSIIDPTNNHVSTYIGQEGIYPNMGGKKGQYLPELLVNAMNNFVRVNQPDAANHYRPFFLLANFPAPRTATTGADDFPVPTDAPFSDEKWPPAAKNRAALITRLDGGIGRLFEQLNKLQMTNNVVIFCSASAAPEKFADTNLDFLLPTGDFRATNSVPVLLPMIVKWPGVIPAGQVSNAPWSPVDFAPTALAIGYMKPTANFSGRSMLPILLGQSGKPLPDRLIY
jgi:arylsulfatase A-like enzyme